MSILQEGLAGLASGAAIANYDTAFQISPIILQNGIASAAPGYMAPITLYMGSLTPAARFLPVPGSTLISQQIGMYPFANQQVAANATIREPLTISLVMISPVNQAGGYLTKLSDFQALQSALASHNAGGGTYIIATPAFIYTYCVMLSMTDVTAEEDKQKQVQYQLDFIQPIVSIAGATAALNALMQNVTNGTQVNTPPAWSGTTAASPANLTSVTAALSAFGAVP